MPSTEQTGAPFTGAEYEKIRGSLENIQPGSVFIPQRDQEGEVEVIVVNQDSPTRDETPSDQAAE